MSTSSSASSSREQNTTLTSRSSSATSKSHITSSTTRPSQTGSSSSAKPTPPTTIINAPPMTIKAPSTTAPCQPSGLRHIVASAVVNIPGGDTGISVTIPETDISGDWAVSISNGLVVDPKSYITSWQVDNGPSAIPLSSGNGGAKMNIHWSNPHGATGTKLTLSFKPHDGTISFGITLSGNATCTPTATVVTSTASSSTAPFPNWPTVNGPAGFHLVGVEQDEGGNTKFISIEVVGSANDICATVVNNIDKYGAYGLLGDGAIGKPQFQDTINPKYINSSTTEFYLVEKKVIDGSGSNPLCGVKSQNDFRLTFFSVADSHGPGNFSEFLLRAFAWRFYMYCQRTKC
ncbi:hypothetical protein GP486_000427 [Trichoglossum hirsutum]|uniref:Uncharacterized protein n=1 Tax=Trichoglossum hirsutum TaxID=265104 RepID=A0A9P8LIR1_9PEZI|nr:hypothetical protein GP486_000427 [Trichoglossum hirsutum]